MSKSIIGLRDYVMAENSNGSVWSRLMQRTKLATKQALLGEEVGQSINENDYAYGYDGVTVSMLLGSGKRMARSRIQIYEKWHYMSGDPVISSALRLHVTMALGGHETTGDTVFIEARDDMVENAEALKYVEDLQRCLAPIFNRIAHQSAFNGCAFGDAYGRVYTKEGIGVVDVYTGEMVLPPLVQPYERGNQTVGFVISTGQKNNDRLTTKQMARLKMSRLLYVPQMRIVERAIRMALSEDDIDKLPVLPSLCGGSFLDSAEEAFDDMTATLSAMVSQRIVSSIDENIFTFNMKGMTLENQKRAIASLGKMLGDSKARAEKHVRENRPIYQRFFHIMPVFEEKQMGQLTQFQNTSGNTNMSIDDVMIHVKRLAGAIGMDLSMLGFAELLSGGLGDGGFIRTSAQAAERGKMIRKALSDFFHNIADLHMLAKYGFVFDPGDRPYKIDFFGAITALQNEATASRERAVNSTSGLVSAMEQLKTLGLKEKTMTAIFKDLMELPESMALMIATDLVAAYEEDKKERLQGIQNEQMPPIQQSRDDEDDDTGD